MFNTVCNIEEAFSSSMNATRRIGVSCDKQRCSIYREIVLIYEPTIGIHTAAYLCLVRKISRVIVSSVPEGDNWIVFRRKGDKLVRGWKLGQRGEIEYVTEINSRLILDETQRWNIVVVKWKKKNDQLHFFHYESFDVLYNTAHFSIYEKILLSCIVLNSFIV